MLKGAAEIDVADFGARVGTAYVGRMGEAGERQVVDEMTPFG
jgi:hypothetical protein